MGGAGGGRTVYLIIFEDARARAGSEPNWKDCVTFCISPVLLSLLRAPPSPKATDTIYAKVCCFNSSGTAVRKSHRA